MSSFNFAQPDVTLKLDLAGVIRQAALSSAIPEHSVEAWVGRSWMDTVAEGGNAQVRRMLEDARTTGVSYFHQVRQCFPSGLELSVEYTTVRLGGSAGLIAIGRNLEAVTELRARLIAAQKSMERDYWKLREVETRYRLLFDASAQPVLLIASDDTRILEANPAAIRALGVYTERQLLPEILATQREQFRAMLSRVRDQGKAPGIVLHLGPDRLPWLVRASLIMDRGASPYANDDRGASHYANDDRGASHYANDDRGAPPYATGADSSAVFVLQFAPSGVIPLPLDKGVNSGLEDVLARLPAGFVVLDAEGKVLRANRAFLELIDNRGAAAGRATDPGSAGPVLGQPLSRWLCGPGDAMAALLETLQSGRTVNGLIGTLRGDKGAEVEVELAAAGNADQRPRYIGVLVNPANDAALSPRSAETALVERVGHSPLRDIVQESVAALERRCIEAALEQSQGNRTAAAEMLGLSRQSLYAKLNRYAVDSDEPPESR